MNETSRLSLLAYIDAQLQALGLFAGEDASSTMRKILHQVCRDDTAFPTLEFDGDSELTASWHVEGSSLCIAVNQQEGKMIALCTWQRPYTRWHLPDNLPEVRQCLHDLSAYVYRHNPDWQKLFAS